MACLRVHSAAVRADIGNIADLLQRVEVVDPDMPGGAGAGDEQMAAVRIRGHIIPAAVAACELNPDHVIRTALLRGGRSSHQGCRQKSCCKEISNSHKDPSEPGYC